MARQSDGVLARFTRDLTADARDGRLEPVRCRTEEIARVIDILLRQGKAMGVAMDAGNMLKPALVRGDFRVIGATTNDEYDRWVCGDPALERRFQRVLVRELSADETLDILKARVERLERHHNV